MALPPVSPPFIFVFIRVRARKYLLMETAGRNTILWTTCSRNITRTIRYNTATWISRWILGTTRESLSLSFSLSPTRAKNCSRRFFFNISCFMNGIRGEKRGKHAADSHDVPREEPARLYKWWPQVALSIEEVAPTVTVLFSLPISTHETYEGRWILNNLSVREISRENNVKIRIPNQQIHIYVYRFELPGRDIRMRYFRQTLQIFFWDVPAVYLENVANRLKILSKNIPILVYYANSISFKIKFTIYICGEINGNSKIPRDRSMTVRNISFRKHRRADW